MISVAPGYWIAIIVYFILNMIKNYIGKDMDINLFAEGALINAALLHEFVPQYNNIVPGGWYVGTTVLIYLLFPLFAKLTNFSVIKKSKIYLVPILFSLIFIGLLRDF